MTYARVLEILMSLDYIDGILHDDPFHVLIAIALPGIDPGVDGRHARSYLPCPRNIISL